MASRLSYGAIPLPVGTSPSGRSKSMTVAAMRLAISAAALAVVCLTMVALSQPDRRTVLSPYFADQYHGAGDKVTWRGCGAGGDCGAKYHWTAKSFSPVAGRDIDIQFTHDHGSYANYYDENGWVEGAHEHLPVTATAPAEVMPEIDFDENAERLPVMEYFAKMFPKERGYSAWLFHKDPEGVDPLTYAEWLAGIKREPPAEDAAEDAAEEGAAEGAAEGAEEGAEEEATEPEVVEEEPPMEEEEKAVVEERPHGENHPMIFGDLGKGTVLTKKTGGSNNWWEGQWRNKVGHGI